MEGDKPRVIVVGSFVMDLVVKAPRRPMKGETLIGTDFGMFVGGKGFNQAVAAARMGAEVYMIGRMGTDLFGDLFMQAVVREGIHADFVVRDPEVGTGVGTPVIDADGDNSIILIPRANTRLSVADVEAAREAIRATDVLLLQLEVPMEASFHAAEIARTSDVLVILNPAPARLLPADVNWLVDVLVPNEVEAAQLTGIPTDNEAGVRVAAHCLREIGFDRVILTLGARGAFMVGSEGEVEVPAYKVSVVDTTAAGDAFCGGLAVALARGMSPVEAVRYANAAGARAVTVMGAEPSMPRAEEVERLLRGEPIC